MRTAALIAAVALFATVAVGHGVQPDLRCFPPERYQLCGLQACNQTTGRCVACHQDSDCYYHSDICVHKPHGANVCVPKPVLTMSWLRYIGTSIIAIGVMTFSLAAGLSGGLALVPLYTLLMGLPMVVAVFASLATVFSQGFFSCIGLALQRHPGRPRPKVNWSLLACWFTWTGLGSVAGVNVSPYLHDWFRVIMMICVVGCTIIFLVRQHETIGAKDAKDDDTPESKVAYFRPMEKLSLLTTVFWGCFCHLLAFEYGCTSAPWFFISFAPTIFIFFQYFAWVLHHKIVVERVKLHTQTPLDIHYGYKLLHTFTLPVCCAVGGFMATTIGVGAGSLMMPLMLKGGLIIEEATATASVATFLIAMQATLSIFIMQPVTIPNQWLAYFIILGFISVITGRVVLKPMLRCLKLDKGPLVCFVVATAITAVLVFIYFAIIMTRMAEYDIPFTFGTHCPAFP